MHLAAAFRSLFYAARRRDAAIVAGLVLLNASPLVAGEPATGLQIAAVGHDQPQLRSRTTRSTPAREAEVAQLLAQIETLAARKEGAVAINVVLVELAPDLPPGTAEALAKDHGLAIVDILDFPSLQLRLIRYRVDDGTAIGDVLPKLRQDARVRSAQTNVVYRIPEQRQPAPATPPSITARAPQEAEAPSPPPPRAQGKATAAKAAARKSASSGLPASVSSSSAHPERLPPSVTQTALRFPTADEPFVNRGGR
jgi:hypothetical protein